jgi:hypothetical protein
VSFGPWEKKGHGIVLIQLMKQHKWLQLMKYIQIYLAQNQVQVDPCKYFTDRNASKDDNYFYSAWKLTILFSWGKCSHCSKYRKTLNQWSKTHFSFLHYSSKVNLLQKLNSYIPSVRGVHHWSQNLCISIFAISDYIWCLWVWYHGDRFSNHEANIKNPLIL